MDLVTNAEISHLVSFRHQLHRLAEPSGAEVRTQSFLLEHLRALAPTCIETFANSYSILAVFDSGVAGATLLFRGDFDAVRVEESINVPYASEMPGVSHKCGHDGHAAILLGLAHNLASYPLKQGRVLLFFQAAEETGDGARLLLETGVLEKYSLDAVYALHNIPGEPMGAVLCKSGSFTCSVVSCEIMLHGRTSHAAEPQKAVCPYVAARTVTDKLLSFNEYDLHRDDFRLVTLVEFRVGEEAYGVTAGDGVLRFTLRAKEDDLLQVTKKNVEEVVCEAVADVPGLSSEVVWREYFAASNNQADAVTRVRCAAETCGLHYSEIELPFSWGEDFGLLTQHYPGALFGLGSGDQQPSLHNPYFDFPDELLYNAVRLFREIVDEGM